MNLPVVCMMASVAALQVAGTPFDGYGGTNVEQKLSTNIAKA